NLPKNDICSKSENYFACSNTGPCISKDHICDGRFDCPNKIDESHCSKLCSESVCPNHTKCIEHQLFGKLCRCLNTGYHLKMKNNSFICEDIDECSSLDYCSFECVNLNGDYKCKCPTADFVFDEETKSCKRLNNRSHIQLLALLNEQLVLYNMLNVIIDHVDIQIYQTNLIQYDSEQMFFLYYDDRQSTVFCTQANNNSIVIPLITKIRVGDWTYDSNDKTLYLIENSTQTLRIYASITCTTKFSIKMISWPLTAKTITNYPLIRLDIKNKYLYRIFDQCIIQTSTHNPTTVLNMYETTKQIQGLTYDTLTQRIFWTQKETDEQYAIYSCSFQLKSCYDTLIRLPVSQPFIFYNDGILYYSQQRHTFEFMYMFGKKRFNLINVFNTTYESVRSIVFLDTLIYYNHSLCRSSNPCKSNEICLTTNISSYTCLFANETLTYVSFVTSPSKIRIGQLPISVGIVSLIFIFILAIIVVLLVKWYRHQLVDKRQQQHQRSPMDNTADPLGFPLLIDD
ncbi:unnamed protein product, partial [Didymodactylos carnosus]